MICACEIVKGYMRCWSKWGVMFYIDFRMHDYIIGCM